MFNSEKMPVVGSLFDSPDERKAREQYEQTAARYRQMKPEIAQSYNNSLRKQLSAFGPTNDFLGGMVGEGFKLDLGPNGLGAQSATPGMMTSPAPQQPGFGQKGVDFIAGFDPAMGEGLQNVFGGLFGVL